jgi:Domain of unknown function (DUF4189)
MDWKQLVAVAVALSCLAATAAAEDGALAYSPSTDEVSSGSSAFFSLRELQIKTLEGCSADDCRIVATFRAGVASSDKSFGVGKGGSQAEAESAAMENCANGGQDSNCHVVGQHCAKE